MRLLDRLTGSSRFQPDTASGAAVWSMSFGQPDNEKILPIWQNAVVAYKGSGVVFGVQQARTNLFTEAEFKFQRLSDKSLFGTSALAVLESPWPNGSTAELLARMSQDAGMAGSSFTRRVNPTRLERLRPDWVSIVSEVTVDTWSDTEVRTVVGFLYDPPASEGRRPEFYPVDEVAHWCPIPDPEANFRGMSWLTPVLREIDADLQMTDYKRAYLENAATPNLLIKYKQKVSTPALDAVAERFKARHGGVQNAFRTVVLDEGADVTLLGNNLKDLMFAAVQSAGENRIAVAGGVPAIVAGLKEGLDAANYAVYDAAKRAFADGTMRPLWRSACQALATIIEVPSDARLWFDEAAISALRQGEKEQADTMFILAQAAQALIVAGYTPESVGASLSAGDITLLEHTGLVSVQMQTPGSKPDTPKGAQ